MMWWIRDPDRLKREVAGIEALRDREPWLTVATPHLLKCLRFAFDFDLVASGETFGFTLEYPAFFPDTPPLVKPREALRLSDHQYGSGGELCLEFRPDNWDPVVTDAMMIESTYRLIAGERPSQDECAEVPSAHQVSLGQQLRGFGCRFLVTEGFLAQAKRLPAGSGRRALVIETAAPNRTWSAYVASFEDAGGAGWEEQDIPDRGDKGEPALILRLADLSAVPAQPARATLDAIITEAGGPEAFGLDLDSLRFIILADGASARAFYCIAREGEPVVIPYRAVDLAEDGSRLPDSYSPLAEKKVGLVGCGSLGSKIAASLARSGVGAFTLVDDDILKPGNLVRHELDSASLGAHKVDGLEARLKAIRKEVKVTTWRVLLGGQESSGTIASVLEDLSCCDLLIDASADSQAFNFTAAAARSALRPMLWAEVYAGGIGGFVARLRSGREPPPHAARQQYLAWCRERGVPWLGDDRGYGARRGEQAPLIADDSDVMVIAAHTARMATDLLIRPAESIFPHSGYVIGLSLGWIFAEPFDTRPFDFGPGGEWRAEVSPERTEAAIEYLSSLFEQGEDEDRATT